MTITVQWISVPTLLSFVVSNDLTLADLNQIGQIGGEAVATHPVYSLIDFTDVSQYPRNLVTTALRSEAFLNFVNDPNARWFAIVSATPAVHYMIEVVMRNTQVKLVDHHDAAEAFLRERAAEAGL